MEQKPKRSRHADACKRYRDKNKEKIRAYAERYYHEHPEYRKGLWDHRKATREQFKAFITLEKSKPCFDCKQLYPSFVMHFDHRDPSTKAYGISDLVRRAAHMDLLVLELTKCDLVCANCHMVRTHKQRLTGMFPWPKKKAA